MGGHWAGAGHEPAVDEILSDPIVQLLARRDGLSLHEIRAVMRHAREALDTTDPFVHRPTATEEVIEP